MSKNESELVKRPTRLLAISVKLTLFIEERKTPVYSSAQHHNIDKKRHNYVLQKPGMVLNELAGPERTKEPT